MQRLSPGTLIVGAFAVLFGLVGAYAVKKYMTQPTPVAVAPKIEKLKIPMAASDLPAGRTLTKDDVMVLNLTVEDAIKAKVPKRYMDQPTQIVGRTLRQAAKRGEAFEPTMFYPSGTGADLADSLKPGERARHALFQGNSVDTSFVTPAAIVDVIYRTIPSGRDVPDATLTLLSRVRVLAVGNTTEKGTTAKDPAAAETRTATLAVDQKQARALKVVDGRGILTLILRNPKDESIADRGGPTTLPGLLGMKEPHLPFVSQIYRRGSVSTMTFRDGMREKIKLDPPFGMPVLPKPKDPNRSEKDKEKDDELEVWPNGWGWGGYGGVGYGSGYGGGTYNGMQDSRAGYGGGYGGYGGNGGW